MNTTQKALSGLTEAMHRYKLPHASYPGTSGTKHTIYLNKTDALVVLYIQVYGQVL